MGAGSAGSATPSAPPSLSGGARHPPLPTKLLHQAQDLCVLPPPTGPLPSTHQAMRSRSPPRNTAADHPQAQGPGTASDLATRRSSPPVVSANILGNLLMAGAKGARGGSWFIRHLRMKRALGIPSNHRMWSERKMRGRDHRRRTWWDREKNCIAIEGVNFAQDTHEGGADRFELIPDSDEEGAAKGSSLLGDDDEYVPETEPQDVVMVTGLYTNQGRLHLGTAFRQWRQLISEVKNESAKVEMDNVKLEKSAKVEMDTVKLEVDTVKLEKESVKVEIDIKLDKESVKVEMDGAKSKMETGKEELDHKASFSDIETDDETCWF